MAIVGAEGSGKTVMLAGLGEMFSRPDADGYYLEPQDIETASYIRRQSARLRSGKWPSSTPPDAAYGLNWLLKRTSGQGRSKAVAQVSCLDFAGEVYCAAFNATLSDKGAYAKEVQQLKKFIESADDLIVLINLRDAISGIEGSDRAVETEFAVLQLLKYVNEESAACPRILLALSQSDMYAETIAACGGPRQTLFRYLPTVANAFGYLDSISIHVVDKTLLNAEGDVVPGRDYSLDGLRPLVNWLLDSPSGLKGFALSIWRKMRRWKTHCRRPANACADDECNANGGRNSRARGGNREKCVVKESRPRVVGASESNVSDSNWHLEEDRALNALGVFLATIAMFAIVGLSFYWAYCNEGFFSAIGKWTVYLLAWIWTSGGFFSWGVHSAPKSGTRYWLITMGVVDVVVGAALPCVVYGITKVAAVIFATFAVLGGLCALGVAKY